MARIELSREFIQSAIQHQSVAAQLDRYAAERVLPRVDTQIEREGAQLTATVESVRRPGTSAGGFQRPAAHVVLSSAGEGMHPGRRAQASEISRQVSAEFTSPKGGGFG